jgi:hypothetical protein
MYKNHKIHYIFKTNFKYMINIYYEHKEKLISRSSNIRRKHTG